MEQIIIRIQNKDKARLLAELLKSLDFVDVIETENQLEDTTAPEGDFFALAGLWEGRDIDLDTLRHRAWPRQAS